MDKEIIIEMLEEIKEKLNNSKSPQIDTSTINNLTTNLQETITITNGYIEQIGKVLEQVKQPVKTEHRHIIDIQSNWVFFSLIGLSVTLLVCGVIIYNQRETITQSQDNDLKYRRVLMKDGASAGDLKELQNMFDYNRDPQAIKELRKDVEEYERLIQEQAQKSEQSRLDAAQAEQLQKEAEALKRKK